MHTIEFTLLQNALDSIERAIDLLAWKDVPDPNSRLKQAVLLVAHAVELLLKERLSRVHPALIWENVDKYPNLAARTVGVDTAINRLAKIGNVSITEADSMIIKSLRNTRNAIEHYKWETTRPEANAIVGQGLSFAIHFAASELSTDLGYRFRDDDTWEKLLTEHAAFAKAHGARVGRKLVDEGRHLQECGYCGGLSQDILTGACSLCGHWERNEEDEDIPF